MASRRGNNGIRGPQSALTDFLAANNISAVQIRADFERRRIEAEQQALANGESAEDAAAQATEAADEAIAAAEQAVENTRKRIRDEKDTIEKIKNAKKKKKSQKKKKKGSGSDVDSNDDDYQELNLYAKSRPAPGQFDNCELCDKRFTVTPYSKDGLNGGLLCTPCGKQLTKDTKAEEKAKQRKPVGRKRRQVESNRLDGILTNRAKSLQQLCIEKVVQHHDSVEELGDLPPALLERLSMIFAKKRVMNSKTLKLFLKPNLHTMAIHDAAYLEVDDYIQMFAVNPGVQKVVLRNACQFKDQVVEYMLEKCDKITYLQLYAANLVSDAMWSKLFLKYGRQLDTLKLTWLDATFDDDVVSQMTMLCPNLTRLKLKLCKRTGEGTIDAISGLKHLEHLSLETSNEVSSSTLLTLIENLGPNLQTLSLESFSNLNDPVLAVIHEKCTSLSKLRITHNDLVTDAAYAALFTTWSNSPLVFVDLGSTRSIDNNNPTGPTDSPIGLGDAGFRALMQHSGEKLRVLDITSCRHIGLNTFVDVFDGVRMYPCLEEVNLSFCSCVDTRVVAGVFRSCPNVKKVIAFGCFDVQDVLVPRGVVLIGVPKAQEAIEQVGAGVGMDSVGGGVVVQVTA